MLSSSQNTLLIPIGQLGKNLSTSDYFIVRSVLVSFLLTWERQFVLCSWTSVNFDFRSNPSRDKVSWCVYLANSVKKVTATQRLCVGAPLKLSPVEWVRRSRACFAKAQLRRLSGMKPSNINSASASHLPRVDIIRRACIVWLKRLRGRHNT